MSAAQEFLDLWRSGNRQLAILARISLRDRSTLAVTQVRAATDQVDTPAGSVDPTQFWPSTLLKVDPVNAPGGFGETSVSLCSGGLTLSPEFDVQGLLLDGALVELWLWDKRLTDFDHALPLLQGVVLNWHRDQSGLALQIRQRTNWNRELTPVDVTPEAYPNAPEDSIGQVIPIVYGRLREVPYRPPFVAYPTSQNNWGLGGTFHSQTKLNGGRRAGAAILVDAGRGSGAANNPAAKILAACHKVKAIGDHTVGAGFYMDADGKLAALDVITPGTDIINTSTEAGILIRDNTPVAWAPIIPNDVDPVSSSAENFRAVLDPWNDTSYAKFESVGATSSLRVIRLRMPSPSNLGDILGGGIFSWIVYELPVVGTNFRLRLRHLYNGTTPIDVQLPVATGKRFVMGFYTDTWGFLGGTPGPYPSQPWAFGECELEIGWPTSTPAQAPTATVIAKVYAAGMAVQYKPRQDIIATATVVSHIETRPVPVGRGGSQAFAPYLVEQPIPAVTEQRGKFYANVDGWPDDGTGTYASDDLVIKYGACTNTQFTIDFSLVPQIYKDMLATVSQGDLIIARVGGPASGTVTSYVVSTGILTVTTANTSTQASGFADITIRTRSALIERAPDVATHMLANYGSEAIAKIERAPGVFGSMVDARAKLKTFQDRDMRYALSVDKVTDVMTALAWVGQDSLSAIFLDRFTDKWRMRPWKLDAPVDYPWTFRPEDIVEPYGMRVSRTPLSSLSTGIQVAYSQSSHSRGALQKARLAWDGSGAGQKWRGVRDESLTVNATNNKLPWFVVGVSGFVGTLTAGNYTPLSFMTHVDAVMKAADPARDYIVVRGATIVAGYNDLYNYEDTPTATVYPIVVPPGQYTYTSLCAYLTAAIAAVLGAIARPIDVTYSFSNRKVMVATANRSMVQRRATAPLRMKRLLATLGFDQTAPDLGPTAGFPSAEAHFAREDECFIVGTVTHEIQLQWETSTFGLNGSRTDCHPLLGFTGLRDTGLIAGGAGVGTCHLAESPKGDMEFPLWAYATRYGAKRDTVVEARTIQESETARELRNRLSAMFVKPRIVVDFATEMAPDLERTRVIQFHPDMDAVIPYPDPDVGTSWQDKRFVVIETEQMTGPVAFYTKVRAVALD